MSGNLLKAPCNSTTVCRDTMCVCVCVCVSIWMILHHKVNGRTKGRKGI